MKAVATEDIEYSIATGNTLRLIVDTTPALIHTGWPDGRLDYFNRVWLNFLGCSLDEVSGWRWTDFIHPDDVAGTRCCTSSIAAMSLPTCWSGFPGS